ncbi:MAG: DNA polymerase II [Sulfolobales archaeon]|nr:DNA polymerase II [Sulfolobales archaeon]
MGLAVLMFYLYDVSYEVVGKEPHILLWGIDEVGNRVVIRDRGFRPYFYVVTSSDVELTRVVNEIRRLSSVKSPIINVEVVPKKLFGRPLNVIKVTTTVPESVREYREAIRKVGGVADVLEADIRFSMRYMIDKGLFPCSWFEAEVSEIRKHPSIAVTKEYELVGEFKPLNIHKPPHIRVLAFDIEVYNPRGVPKPERDPVIIISMMNSEGDVKVLELSGDTVKNDSRIISEFMDYIQTYDPDVIVGYNSNRFDWPYLIERSKVLGIRMDVGRVRDGVPRTSVYGHISIPGRLNVDLFDFVEEIGEIKVKSLDVVAEYLGVMRRVDRVLVPWYEISKYWDDLSKREVLIRYAVDDVKSTMGIAEKILPFAMQLSSLTGLPLDQVGSASVGFRLEWYLMRSAYRYSELIPNRVERFYEPYKGAIVLEPVKGVHENIAVLDFTSMYPNIMIKYNVGPDTFVEYDCSDELCNVIPEVGYKFRKDPPGFYKAVLETLLNMRKAVRELMKEFPQDSVEYRVLDERQKALKVLANASYGYMGWVGARWYFRQGAEAVTALGRDIIGKAIEIARELGLRVIYGDTDSLFVSYGPPVERFIDLVMDRLGLEIKVDKIYRRIFFTEAKKRYIGLTVDGLVDIVGFEAVRGDWAEIAKEVQELVAYSILAEGSVSKAVDLVNNVIRELREGRIPLDKLIIWKTITKPLSDYEVSSPHVSAARRLLDMGGRVEVGDKVGYVIVKGGGSISSRAYPYISVRAEDIDADYYIDHQIVPASLRILEYFGVSEKQLKTISRGVKTLFDFSRRG